MSVDYFDHSPGVRVNLSNRRRGSLRAEHSLYSSLALGGRRRSIFSWPRLSFGSLFEESGWTHVTSPEKQAATVNTAASCGSSFCSIAASRGEPSAGSTPSNRSAQLRSWVGCLTQQAKDFRTTWEDADTCVKCLHQWRASSLVERSIWLRTGYSDDFFNITTPAT